MTVEHVARVAVRHPEMVAAGRHYGIQVADLLCRSTRNPRAARKHGADREGRPGAHRGQPARGLPGHGRRWSRRATGSALRSTTGGTGRPPRSRSSGWRSNASGCMCCPRRRMPPRWVRPGWSTPTRRSGSGRCATPPHRAWSGAEVWVRAAGDELVIVADLNALALRPSLGAGATGRAGRGRPPRPVHAGPAADRAGALPRPPPGPVRAPRPPTPKPTSAAETAFLALGPGAEAWLVEAAAAARCGCARAWTPTPPWRGQPPPRRSRNHWGNQRVDVPVATDKQGSKLVRWAAIEACQRTRTGQQTGRGPGSRIITARGRNIGVVAAARRLLTLVYYGLRDGQIRSLAAGAG